MNHEEIKRKAKDIGMDKLGVDDSQVTDKANFILDLGADSLDTVELAMEFEKEFDIAINDDEWEKVDTFSEAVALIEKKLEKK